MVNMDLLSVLQKISSVRQPILTIRGCSKFYVRLCKTVEGEMGGTFCYI